MRALEVVSFADLPLLLRTLSRARFDLLKNLREKGACSIYELAKRLERDDKNVHTDVTQLAGLGLVERQDDGRVAVAWDVLRAELRF